MLSFDTREPHHDLPTKAELQTAIDGISVAADLSDLPTKAQLQTAIDGIPAVDLSDLPTNSELQNAINGISVAADLTNLPTKSDLTAALNTLPWAHLPTNVGLESALRTATSNLPSKLEVKAELLPVSDAVSALERTLPADPTSISLFTHAYEGQTAINSPFDQLGKMYTLLAKVNTLLEKVDQVLDGIGFIVAQL